MPGDNLVARFLLDENISQTVSQILRDSGFSVLHVEEIRLSNSADEDILSFAKKRKMTVITHDKDFGNLIRFPVQDHYGVILLRLRDQRPENVLLHLLPFLKNHKNLKARLVILREDEFRIV